MIKLSKLNLMSLMSFIFIILSFNVIGEEYFIGDTVYINSSHGLISASPHHLTTDGYINLEIETYSYTGNMNVMFGFDSLNAMPMSIDLYSPHQLSYIDGNGTTIYYTEDYININNLFEKAYIELDGKNVWYYIKDVSIIANQKIKFRFFLDLIKGSGKYDVAFFPSSYDNDYMSAYNDGNMILLDPTYTLNEDIISYYKFDGNANDELESENGTVSGAVNHLDNGFINEGYNFDGINDYITFDDMSTVTKDNDYSISFWFKLDNTGINMNLYSFEHGGTDRNNFAITSSNIIVVSLYDGSWHTKSGSFSDTTSFHHVVISYNSTDNTFVFYLDNVEQIGTTTGISSGNVGYRIGSSSNANEKYFTGNIDEFGIWNRQLTRDEMEELYLNEFSYPFIFLNGNGSLTNPYNLSTCMDLLNIEKVKTIEYEYFQLINNIDCTDYEFIPIMNASIFRGSFNGNGFSINNLTLLEGGSNQGLFYRTDFDTIIKDLTINNIDINNNPSFSGCLIGEVYKNNTVESFLLNNININNCDIDGSLRTIDNGASIGGLIGNINTNTPLNNGFNIYNINILNSNLNGGSNIGGIVGGIALHLPNNIYFKNISTQINLETSYLDVLVGGIFGRLDSTGNINTYIDGYLNNNSGVGSGITGLRDSSLGDKLYINDYLFTGNIDGYSIYESWSCISLEYLYLDNVIIRGVSNTSDVLTSSTDVDCIYNLQDVYFANETYTTSSKGGIGLSNNDLKLDLYYYNNFTDWDIHNCMYHSLDFMDLSYNYGDITFNMLNYYNASETEIGINATLTSIICDCYFDNPITDSYSYEPDLDYYYLINTSLLNYSTYNTSITCNGGSISEVYYFNYTCTPNYYCSSFDDCSLLGVETCLIVNDSNSCGNIYTGELSSYDDSCTPTTSSVPLVIPLELGECPSNLPSLMLLMIPLIIGFVLMFMAFMFNIPIIHVVSGIFIFMSGYVFVDCNRLFGIFIITLGLMLIPFAFMLAFSKENE